MPRYWQGIADPNYTLRVIKVASVQANVLFGDPNGNAEVAIAELERLQILDVKLAVFPEAFLTGYCVSTAEQARSIAIPRDHESMQRIEFAARKLGIVTIVGFAENEGGTLYNSAVLFDPLGINDFYRKAHLPFLGYDRFATPGAEIRPFETSIGKIGVLICFDFRFPEACRSLALMGIDILCVPTNWPTGTDLNADCIAPTRANENGVFVLTCNRAGSENGYDFIGKSKIIDVRGKILASAPSQADTLIAKIDLSQARNKQRVVVPGEYETNNFATRQPRLYSVIADD